MSDTKTDGEKTLSVSAKTLTLKRPMEQGTVRQSFSHGRSKAVVVEKKKQRSFVRPGEATKPEPAVEARPPEPRPVPPRAPDVRAPEVRAPAPRAPEPRAPQAKAPEPVAPEPQPIEARAVEPTVVEVPAAPVPAPRPAAPAAPVAEATPAAPEPAAPPVAARTAVPRREPAGDNGRAPPRVEARAPRPETRPETRAPARAEARPAPRPSEQRTPAARGPGGRAGGMVLRTLTEEEKNTRLQALADSRLREAEDRRRAEEDAIRRADEDARHARERAEAERRKAEEEARRKFDEEVRRKTEDEAKRRLGEGGAPGAAAAPGARLAPGARPVLGRPGAAEEEEARGGVKRPGVRAVTPPPPVKREKGDERRRGRLTVTSATSQEEERMRSLGSFRRRQQRLHRGAAAEPKEKIAREIVLPETITIQELANRMAERAVDVIRLLMAQGQMHKITDTVDADTAELVASELGHTVRRVSESDVEEGLFSSAEADDNLEPRPPVVTIMGHVDHGKTSLLDALRQTNVVAGEAGGITQHIGAYQVASPTGGKITFIDTPGHAAFTAMRARGARVTDIVVLVVAADDGVMPQTVEAISHAKAAGVPMIVAINKIDKPDANPLRVRTELLQHDVQVESMGGETQEVEVSALQKTNLEGLLEAISLQAEVLELRANPNRTAEGSVIEAKLDKGRGPVATVLVERGTLKVGDILVAGSEWGRVRALLDDKGANVASAGPSVPVEVLGFNGTPEAGDRFAVVENEARAREVADYRERQRREKAQARGAGRGSLEQMMANLRTDGQKIFPLVIKGDVQGSVEAIAQALEKLGTDEVVARVLHAGVGGITESDVTLAQASGAAIIGFNVRANAQARAAAERDGIELRYYNVIYDLVDDVKKAMSGLLAPERRETMLGNALILEIFGVSKVGKVAGCRVTDGVVQRGAGVRLIRDNVVIHEGELAQLKRFKDDVREVVAGQECGMSFANYQDMRPGDVIECYRVEEIARTL